MLDQGSGGTRLERVHGRGRIALSGGRLRDLHQSGAAKVMLPRAYAPMPEIVFLNTAGGVTGGDRLRFELALENGRAMATTQTAERAYRSPDGPAELDLSLTVGPGAHLSWLPQETILYDGARLTRNTHVAIEGDGTVLMVDMFVLGRVAMGEAVRQLDLTDRRTVTRDGRALVMDILRLRAEDLTRPGAAGLGAAKAIAAIHLIAPDAEDRLGRFRAALPSDGSAAASAWDGRLSARAMHDDPSVLRRLLARALPILAGHEMPRVWPRLTSKEQA